MCLSHLQGYTIPLDKRLAADGRGLQEVAINDQFAKVGGNCWGRARALLGRCSAAAQQASAGATAGLHVLPDRCPEYSPPCFPSPWHPQFTEALYIAEQKARSAVEARSKMQRELLAREKVGCWPATLGMLAATVFGMQA